MRIATGEEQDEREATAKAAAQSGKLGGAARARNLTAEQRAQREARLVADEKIDLRG